MRGTSNFREDVTVSAVDVGAGLGGSAGFSIGAASNLSSFAPLSTLGSIVEKLIATDPGDCIHLL